MRAGVNRLFLMVLAAAFFIVAPHANGSSNDKQPVKRIYTRVQSLGESLRELSVRFGQSVMTESAEYNAVTAPALSGEYTLSQALEILLKPTDLQYRITSNGVIVGRVENTVSQTPIEEVSVTGLRASLGASREQKRRNDVISDVIVSSDLASYPDRNLAESMQRIPGMSITREAGEGRQIMLRGLSPDFTLVMLNGMTVLANNDSPMDSRLQKQRDRSFDLNLFATDLFSEIQVLKTYDAELPTGGMAGIVALSTAHPFDHPGLHWNVSAQGGNNQFVNSLSKRISAMVSNTRGHWGALFSVVYGTRDYQEMGANTFRWRQIRPDGADISALSANIAEQWQNGELFVPRGNRYSVWQSDMDRTGIGASIEYKSDFAHVSLDWLYGRLSGERFEYHLYPRGYRSTPVIENETRVVDAVVNEKNELVYADYLNGQVGTESRYQQVATNYNQWVINLTNQWGPTLKGKGVIGWEQARYDMPQSNKAYMQGATDISVDYRGKYSRFANINYKADLTQADFWRMKELDAESYFATTAFFNARYVVSYAEDVSREWKVGVDWVSFNNQTDLFDIQDLLMNDWEKGSLKSTVPIELSRPLNSHPRLSWLTLDTSAVFNAFGLPNNIGALKESDVAMRAEQRAERDEINEHRLGLFSSLTLGSGNWKVNPSLRIEHENIAVSASDTEPELHRYLSRTHWLPALNLRYSISAESMLRLALSRTLGRPQLDDLTTSVRYDEEQNILYGYNEKLRPYSAYNLDIAWEEYASDNNRFAINAFSKFLDDYIVYVNETKPVSELAAYNGSISLPDAGEVTLVSAKNAEQSWLYGIETSAEIDMTWPGNPQNHFGVVGIVSYTRGKVRYYNTDTGELLSVKGLPFLSPWLANLTAYWESYDLSVRLSVTYRDDYVARVDSRTLQDEDETGFEDSMYVDAVVAWHIGDKWEVRFEATNLTNQREIQYSDSAHRPYNTAVSGRDYYVGITYRY